MLELEKKLPSDTALADSATTNRAKATIVLSGITTSKIKHQQLGLVQRAVSIDHALWEWFQQAGEKLSSVQLQMAFSDVLHYVLITGVHESATSPSVHVLQAHLESC